MSDQQRRVIMYLGKPLGNMERNYYRGSRLMPSILDRQADAPFLTVFDHDDYYRSSIVLLIGYLVALSTPIFKLEDVSFKGIKRVSPAQLLQKGGLENGVNLLA
jgi:hypothetical protein